MQVFLERSYLKMHIFSKTTNDVSVLEQRLVSTSNTSVTALHSLSKKLNTFLNELFNATLAERISSELACHVSQL